MLRWWSGLTHQSRKLEQANLPVVGSNPTLSANYNIDILHKKCYYVFSFKQLFFKRMIGETMDYTVIVIQEQWSRDAKVLLEKQVKKLIAEGWEPIGGVSIAMRENSFCDEICLAQAMIRRR